MRLSNMVVLFTALLVYSLPASAQVKPALAGVTSSEISVNFTGDFPKMTCSGELANPCLTGLRLDSSASAGLLVNYRHHFTTWSSIELNYDHTRFLENYSSGPSIRTRMDEVTVAYVVTFGSLTSEHFRPFAEIGLGALICSPISPSTAETQDHAPLLYGGGFDLTDGGHLAVRFGYRGLIFEAPDFGISSLSTGISHVAEPYVGIVVHF